MVSVLQWWCVMFWRWCLMIQLMMMMMMMMVPVDLMIVMMFCVWRCWSLLMLRLNSTIQRFDCLYSSVTYLSTSVYLSVMCDFLTCEWLGCMTPGINQCDESNRRMSNTQLQVNIWYFVFIYTVLCLPDVLQFLVTWWKVINFQQLAEDTNQNYWLTNQNYWLIVITFVFVVILFLFISVVIVADCASVGWRLPWGTDTEHYCVADLPWPSGIRTVIKVQCYTTQHTICRGDDHTRQSQSSSVSTVSSRSVCLCVSVCLSVCLCVSVCLSVCLNTMTVPHSQWSY